MNKNNIETRCGARENTRESDGKAGETPKCVRERNGEGGERENVTLRQERGKCRQRAKRGMIGNSRHTK